MTELEQLKKQNEELILALRTARMDTLREAADQCRLAAEKYVQRGQHSGIGWQFAVYLEREIMALPSEVPASNKSELADLAPDGVIEITAADAALIVDLIENPREPNEAMRRAFARFSGKELGLAADNSPA